MDNKVKKYLGNNQELIKKQYNSLVNAKVRERYSIDEECAILRKKMADLDNGEFEEYNSYVERCKNDSREELGL